MKKLILSCDCPCYTKIQIFFDKDNTCFIDIWDKEAGAGVVLEEKKVKKLIKFLKENS